MNLGAGLVQGVRDHGYGLGGHIAELGLNGVQHGQRRTFTVQIGADDVTGPGLDVWCRLQEMLRWAGLTVTFNALSARMIKRCLVMLR